MTDPVQTRGLSWGKEYGAAHARHGLLPYPSRRAPFPALPALGRLADPVANAVYQAEAKSIFIDSLTQLVFPAGLFSDPPPDEQSSIGAPHPKTQPVENPPTAHFRLRLLSQMGVREAKGSKPSWYSPPKTRGFRDKVGKSRFAMFASPNGIAAEQLKLHETIFKIAKQCIIVPAMR